MGKGGLVLNLRIGAQVPGSFRPRGGVFSPCLWQRLSSMRPAHVLTASESTGLPLSPGSPGVHLVLGLVTSLKSAVWAGALSPQTGPTGPVFTAGDPAPHTRAARGPGSGCRASESPGAEAEGLRMGGAAPEHVHIIPPASRVSTEALSPSFRAANLGASLHLTPPGSPPRPHVLPEPRTL